jgi:hypothetical protein
VGVGLVSLGLGLFVYHLVQDEDDFDKGGSQVEAAAGEEGDDFYSLLPVEREDDSNNLKFEYFLRIFETA